MSEAVILVLIIAAILAGVLTGWWLGGRGGAAIRAERDRYLEDVRRAMADLAGNAGDGPVESRPVALADIAARQDISLSYLEQLFAKLRRGGLVTSVRGPGGGYRLSRPSGELRIADIILAVDEPITTTRCKPGGTKGCTKTGARCVTHDLWEELGQQIHVFLSSVSLADVVDRKVLGRSRPCNDVGSADRGNETGVILDSETAAA